MSRPLVVRAAAGVLAAALLSACAQEVPTPDPQDAPESVPAVQAVQVDRIQADLEAALAAGDEALDPAPLAGRVAGPALELRQGGYTVRRQLPEQAEPEQLAGERLVDAVPASTGWPRHYFTVTRAGADAVPHLLVMTQARARDPYVLSAFATLLPGVTLPKTAPATVGTEAVDPASAAGLVASPADAVAQYADLLAKGPASEFAEAFAADDFRTQVLAEQAGELAIAGSLATYSVAHAPREGALWSVRTEDGGALVVAALDGVRTFTVTTAGAKVGLPDAPDLAVLAGVREITKALTVTSTEVVLLAVPPDGAAEPVRAMGSARVPVAASAS